MIMIILILIYLKKKKKGIKFKDGETIEIKFNDGLEGINTDIKNDEKKKR